MPQEKSESQKKLIHRLPCLVFSAKTFKYPDFIRVIQKILLLLLKVLNRFYILLGGLEALLDKAYREDTCPFIGFNVPLYRV
jgi:hypothetical protein